jgi:ribonuclease P protein component
MRINLSKRQRLTTRQLNGFFNKPRCIKSDGFKLCYQANAQGFSRFAISIGKKYGNAVQRNRARRVYRVFFRQHQHDLLANDYVLILYTPCVDMVGQVVRLAGVLKRSGLMIDG